MFLLFLLWQKFSFGVEKGFEQIISLGDNYFPKAQINFYFSQPGKNKKHTGGGHLFDSLKYTTGFDCVGKKHDRFFEILGKLIFT